MGPKKMANNTPITFSVISEEEPKQMREYINAMIPDITQMRSSPVKIINLVVNPFSFFSFSDSFLS